MYQFGMTSFAAIFSDKQNTPRDDSDYRVPYPARMADRTGKPSFRYHPYVGTRAPISSTCRGEAFVENMTQEIPSSQPYVLNVSWTYGSNTLPSNVCIPNSHALNPVTVCSELFNNSTLQNLKSVCNLAFGNCEPSSAGSESLATAYAVESQKRVAGHEHPFHWRRRTAAVEGMMRTRDKYRVVYTEKQRRGLERAFEENRFISLQTKLELAKELGLSERQIKLWFQNRRAKERRDVRKSKVTKTPEGSLSSKVNTASNTSLSDVTSTTNNTDWMYQAEVIDNNFQAEQYCHQTINTHTLKGLIMSTDSSPLCMNESALLPNPWLFGDGDRAFYGLKIGC